jgi:hypothetical protein
MNATLEKTETPLSPEPLYQLVMGFTFTRTLLAAHRLGLFELLADREMTAAEIVDAKGFSLPSTEMLLDACVSLKLCTKTVGRYTATPMIQHFLTRQGSGYLGHFFDHFNDHMVPAWFYLEDTIRTGEPQMHRVRGDKNDHFFQAMDRSSQDLNTFMQTMEEHSLLEGGALAHAYDFSPHNVLLDVAGGTGAMSVSILRRYPHMKAIVLERPTACDSAIQAIESHGFSDRIRVQPGDMFKSTLTTEADVLLLSGTLHNWGPKEAQAILTQCSTALARGATLLISEQILDEEKAASPLGPLCSLNMMVLMGGREYSQSEYKAMLDHAHFDLEVVRPTGGLRQLLIARRR